jgi:hypothetical protein
LGFSEFCRLAVLWLTSVVGLHQSSNQESLLIFFSAIFLPADLATKKLGGAQLAAACDWAAGGNIPFCSCPGPARGSYPVLQLPGSCPWQLSCLWLGQKLAPFSSNATRLV